MVDFEAAKLGMREDELPKFRQMAKQVFLFIPIVIPLYALFQGHSVIRAGTLATAAAAVVSWLTPFRIGLSAISRGRLNRWRENRAAGRRGVKACGPHDIRGRL